MVMRLMIEHVLILKSNVCHNLFVDEEACTEVIDKLLASVKKEVNFAFTTLSLVKVSCWVHIIINVSSR